MISGLLMGRFARTPTLWQQDEICAYQKLQAVASQVRQRYLW